MHGQEKSLFPQKFLLIGKRFLPVHKCVNMYNMFTTDFKFITDTFGQFMFYFLVLRQQSKSITPFNDTKLDVVKWLSFEGILNSVS